MPSIVARICIIRSEAPRLKIKRIPYINSCFLRLLFDLKDHSRFMRKLNQNIIVNAIEFASMIDKFAISLKIYSNDSSIAAELKPVTR